MKSIKTILRNILILVILGASALVAQENPAKKWEKDIQVFMEWDNKNSFPENAVLFVGSSSILYWKTHQAFPNQNVINRGFGGSEISDLLYYYDEVVLKYKPRIIVLYSGDNDIAHGKNVATTLNDYKRFIKLTHDKLPDTSIVILPIKPCPARLNFWPAMEQVNILVEEIVKKDEMVSCIDTARILLTEENLPNHKFFVPDNIHLNEAGYKLWNDLLNKKLDQLVNRSCP